MCLYLSFFIPPHFNRHLPSTSTFFYFSPPRFPPKQCRSTSATMQQKPTPPQNKIKNTTRPRALHHAHGVAFLPHHQIHEGREDRDEGPKDVPQLRPFGATAPSPELPPSSRRRELGRATVRNECGVKTKGGRFGLQKRSELGSHSAPPTNQPRIGMDQVGPKTGPAALFNPQKCQLLLG